MKSFRRTTSAAAGGKEATLVGPTLHGRMGLRRGGVASVRTCTVVSIANGRERSVLALSGVVRGDTLELGVWLVLVRYDCDVVCCVLSDSHPAVRGSGLSPVEAGPPLASRRRMVGRSCHTVRRVIL